MLQQNLYNENNRYLKWLFKNIKQCFDIDIFIVAIALIGALVTFDLDNLCAEDFGGEGYNTSENVVITFNLFDIFKINYGLVFLIGLGNILLVMAAGYIPSRRASNMEIVSCIYNR